MRRSVFQISCITLGIILTVANVSRADLPLDISNTQPGFTQLPSAASDITVGWQFTITTPIQVSGLGIFDFNSDGLINNNHSVGLWTSGGTLLASTTLSGNGSYQIASSFTGGRWDLNSITPIILNPGTYVTGAFFNQVFVPPSLSNSDPFQKDGADTGNPLSLVNFFPGLTFTGSRIVLASGFQFPSTLDNTVNSYFGPTLDISTVPEPATIVLVVLSISVALLYVWRRFGKRKSVLLAEIDMELLEE